MLTDSHRRLILGVLAIVLAGVGVWLNWLDPELGAEHPMIAAGAIRMVPVLAVLWLAMPEMKRGPGGILFLFAFLCAIAVIFSSGKTALKFIVPAISVLLVLGYLRKLTTAFGGGPRTERRR
jgi:hypothetical protein